MHVSNELVAGRIESLTFGREASRLVFAGSLSKMAWAMILDSVLSSLARDELPWARAWVAEFRDFAARFTLHDSTWVGIFLAVRESNEAILVVEWDAHWLPEPLRSECLEDSPGPPCFGNPFLLIRLSGLSAVELRGYENPLSGRPISDTSSRVERGVKILEVVDLVGGTVHLEYIGQVEFLAIRSQDNRELRIGG